MIIDAYSSGFFRLFKKKWPHWPDYVIKDFLKPALDHDDLVEYTKAIDDMHIQKWKLETLHLTEDMFEPQTIKRFHERHLGETAQNDAWLVALFHSQQPQSLQPLVREFANLDLVF